MDLVLMTIRVVYWYVVEILWTTHKIFEFVFLIKYFTQNIFTFLQICLHSFYNNSPRYILVKTIKVSFIIREQIHFALITIK